MRTWERGSGITLASGTGASAVCVSGVLLGLCSRSIDAKVPGGILHIEWPKQDDELSSVFMTGPATDVFEGTINLKALLDYNK
jgi:diaminopimelate epimerase